MAAAEIERPKVNASKRKQSPPNWWALFAIDMQLQVCSYRHEEAVVLARFAPGGCIVPRIANRG
jgi:hypothetical protein